MLKEILQASAGTGKTHQIVQKGLAPAAGGDYACLRRTVFLSFSNAAAEEIKTRLYEKIAPAKGGTLLACIGSAETRVYTIHSFCFELARIFRYELGLPADARFPTNEDAGIWTECVDSWFRSDWDFTSLCAALNYKPGTVQYDLLKALHALGNKNALREFIKKHGQKVFFLGELMTVGEPFPEKAPAMDVESIAKELEKLNILDTSSDALKSKTDSTLPELQRVLELAVPALRHTRPALEAIITHIGRHVYIPYMYEQGVFDFDSLVYFVVKTLKRMKAQEGMEAFLRRLEDEGFGFDRLFIDEAQDCDILMNNLIGYFLGDNCRVETTLVGDAKQSIYRWRNAYPEEFLKMCEEAAAVGKRKPLLESYRVGNPNTLDFINGLVDGIKDKLKGTAINEDGSREEIPYFDYEVANDRLKPPAAPGYSWPKTTAELKVGYCVISKELAVDPAAVSGFLAGAGRTGVVFRSRSDFRKSRLGLMPGITLQYKLAEPFEEERKYGAEESCFTPDEVTDIDPDYFLLKTLLWCFTAAGRDEAAAALLLSRKGLHLARAVWPEHLNDEAVSSTEKFITAAGKIYAEIQALYYGRAECSVTETLYRLLEKKGLWANFFRPECLLSPERVARVLNHALAALYLHETSPGGASHDGDGALLTRFSAAKIPYESSISYDVDDKGLSFAEAVTIHSSKGLTYDKVIVIANFNKVLKAEPDGREGEDEFPYLFDAQFEKAITAAQKISINYFPYLGRLPALCMSKSPVRFAGVGRLYNATFKRVKAEKANLLYVAVTRTKERVLFIDNGNPKKPGDLQKMLKDLQADGKISLAPVPTVGWARPAPENRALRDRGTLGLPGAFRLLGVRSHIKAQAEASSAPRISGAAAGLVSGVSMNMYIGVRVHQLVAELMQRTPSAADYEAVIKASPVSALDEPGRLAAEIMLRPENKALLQPLFKAGAKNLPELRVWGLCEKGETLLNGVIDGVLINPGEIQVLEYKTIFGAAGGQKELGEKQKQVYQTLLGRLTNAHKLTGAVVEIKAK